MEWQAMEAVLDYSSTAVLVPLLCHSMQSIGKKWCHNRMPSLAVMQLFLDNVFCMCVKPYGSVHQYTMYFLLKPSVRRSPFLTQSYSTPRVGQWILVHSLLVDLRPCSI
eukprot:scpid111837/ scgid9960/ 